MKEDPEPFDTSMANINRASKTVISDTHPLEAVHASICLSKG